jgi:tetratricopeptide (TPR) repeat protein
MGRTEEGLAENQRAEALDPLSPEASLLLGWGLYYAHRYDQAVVQLARALDLDPEILTLMRCWATSTSNRAGSPMRSRRFKKLGVAIEAQVQASRRAGHNIVFKGGKQKVS